MPLDVYDIQPRPMMKYKANNGWHFNECASQYAVSLMKKKNPVNGKTEPIEPMTAKQVDEILSKHAPWVEELKSKHNFTRENTAEILKEEVGKVFAKVLEHAGVYKRTEDGRAAFLRFVDCVNQA